MMNFGVYLGQSIDRISKNIESKSGQVITMYHYTSREGIEGIIKENDEQPSFWCTRYDVLNDYSEGHEFLIKYQNTITKLLNKSEISAEFYSIIKEIEPNNLFLFLDVRDQLIHPVLCDAYICSFSGKRNSLPMWNYYGKTDRDNAFNIGVTVNKIGSYWDKIEKDVVGRKLFKVIYDDAEKEKIIAELVRTTYELYRDPDLTCKGDKESVIRQFYSAFFNTYRFAFKYEDFSFEDEYRLVLIVPQNISFGPNDYKVQFRESNGLSVPYIEYCWNDCKLVEVICGPNGKSVEEKKTYAQDVENFLKGRQCYIKTDYSDIPVRY